MNSAIIRKFPAAFIMCIIVLSSCGTSSQIIRYTPLISNKFDPLEQPAEITALSEQQLAQQGYVKIGIVNVTQVLKECYQRCYAPYACSSSYDDCDEHSFSGTATVEALSQAAKKGGHLVLLTADNQAANRDVQKNSAVCNRSRVEYRTSSRPVYSASGTYYREVQEQRTICEEYQQKRGWQRLRMSSGSVWRKGN